MKSTAGPSPTRATLPAIHSFVAADPDDGDTAVSIGDTLTIAFDTPTDRCGGPTHGDRHMVDDIFRFSPALADDYTGAWLDEVTFVVTIVDARGSLASTDTMGVNSPRSYAPV